MKALLLLPAALLFATPAFAQQADNFVGPRIEATAGIDDFNGKTVSYGVGGGYDLRLGTRGTIGVEADAADFFDRRDIGVGIRAGYAVNPNVLLYTTAGYANLSGLDGVRVGGGLEFANARSPLYGKVEYRYTNFERGVDRHAGVVGVGLRF